MKIVGGHRCLIWDCALRLTYRSNDSKCVKIVLEPFIPKLHSTLATGQISNALMLKLTQTTTYYLATSTTSADSNCTSKYNSAHSLHFLCLLIIARGNTVRWLDSHRECRGNAFIKTSSLKDILPKRLPLTFNCEPLGGFVDPSNSLLEASLEQYSSGQRQRKEQQPL